MQKSNFINFFTGLFLIAAILFGNFSAFAQTKRASTVQKASSSSSPKDDKKHCNSGYTGSVSYTKTVATSSSGRYGSAMNMKRVYQANIIIRDDGKLQGTAAILPDGGVNGSFNFTGQATASVSENDNRLDVSEKDEYCNVSMKGAGKARRVRCESRYNRKSEASGTNENTSVFIGLRGRTLVLSLGNLPKLNGTVSTDSASSCTGTCAPQKPVGSNSSVEIKDGGERTASTDEGVISFNPTSFNRISGSWSRNKPTPGGTVTETYTWNLSRCAPKLEIADLSFEHKRVPNPDQWFGIDPLSGTTDGNLVKIKAKVFNNGGDTAYANVKFSETKSNESLPDATVSVAVKPGEYREVEYEWDTSGFAWDENQKNQSEREIKAELEGGNAETAKIKILPKPVILVHGLWSNAAAWAEYPLYLREAHSFAWEAFAVGADPEIAKMSTGDHPGNYKPTNTIFQNAQELGKQIKFVREQKNAWHVDVVAHSMGGLISRQYINAFMAPVFDGKPEIMHLVMLGTPNMGSPCADLVGNVFEFFEQNDMNAMRELRPSVVAEFNSRTTNRKGVKFSILIGYAIPQTCQTEVRGDGVVPVMSARFNIADRDYAFRDHISLTDDVNFKRFVMPRIAIGPKKARNEQTTAWLENRSNENYASNDRYEFSKYFQKASFKRKNVEQTDNAENITTRKKIELQPKQTQEIEIPAEAGKNNGVLIVATTAVVATLSNSGGAVIGKSEGGTNAVKNPFRTIFADKNAGGILKLKLENFGNETVTVFVAGFANSPSNSGFMVEAGKVSANGRVNLQAKLIENNSPVLGAKITATIAGHADEITFFDDGKHGDGAANDGVYGASIEKLAKGEFFVEAKAEANNLMQMTIAVIKNGAATAPAKKAAKAR